MKKSPARLDTAEERFKSTGGELKAFYFAMGRYDTLVIGEGPEDETAIQLALTIAPAGAVRTETMRVFPEDEYRKPSPKSSQNYNNLHQCLCMALMFALLALLNSLDY